MITLTEIKDWLKTFGIGQFFYTGKLVAKKEKSIGVYSRKRSGPPRMALGGLSRTSYDVKSISILVHWNRNYAETEAAALELFEKLRAAEVPEIDGMKALYLSLEVPEPQDVGTDENGVYEQVIWFDLYYEREVEK